MVSQDATAATIPRVGGYKLIMKFDRRRIAVHDSKAPLGPQPSLQPHERMDRRWKAIVLRFSAK